VRLLSSEFAEDKKTTVSAFHSQHHNFKLTTKMPIFQFHTRSFSDSELSSHNAKSGQSSECDLITFLGVVQSMEIDILPLTWQPALDLAGEGGTSRVTQSIINIQTNFVFKCVSDKQRQKYSESDIFQSIINEITVLGHPKLREHNQVNQLQGVCWDIAAHDKIWPVLVFEKSQFKDLSHFLRLTVGRNLPFKDRLELCVDVGTAIIDMNSLGK